jgi:hypothetical protein
LSTVTGTERSTVNATLALGDGLGDRVADVDGLGVGVRFGDAEAGGALDATALGDAAGEAGALVAGAALGVAGAGLEAAGAGAATASSSAWSRFHPATRATTDTAASAMGRMTRPAGDGVPGRGGFGGVRLAARPPATAVGAAGGSGEGSIAGSASGRPATGRVS